MRYLGIDITFEDDSKVPSFDGLGYTRINHGIRCITLIQELLNVHANLKPIVLVLKKLL